MELTTSQWLIASFALLCVTSHSYSQTNSLPASGNVGIGTTSPAEKLTVNGSARIDSTLTVKDSMIVDRDAHIRSDLQVDGKTILGGDLFLKSLRDSTISDGGVLLIDSMGKVKNGGDLKSLVYSELALPPCKDDAGGNITPALPVWLNGPGKLYTSSACVPDVRVGIGQNNPDSKLHITTAVNRTTHPIIVDKRIQGNPIPYKLMELDNTGLLYAREVKVNLDSWPDYVFDEGYQLMPLSELQAFIRDNNHLPNVPSACEMEEQGINVAKSNVMLMEKVEELTLYMLQINEKVNIQEKLLQQQQETIRLQQELIQQLKEQVKP
ncbi:MAG: hypothetical protein K0S23_3565 [Fluviicola sp.]|jgi:hypothetical protein|uniref:hypothetical protein n=1 Tax=Fluviicola sp. TaxID=1917219 RepID=UPI00261BD5C5|nr:hypothetical protein [Fluviicola sp.]MDF3029258.1 hypothetical protein [Fluviicola sp.]